MLTQLWYVLLGLTVVTVGISYAWRRMLRGFYVPPAPGTRSATKPPSDVPTFAASSQAAVRALCALPMCPGEQREALADVLEEEDPAPTPAPGETSRGLRASVFTRAYAPATPGGGSKRCSSTAHAVFLHGGPGTPFAGCHETFHALLAARVDRPLRVFYPHQRGSGLSSRVRWWDGDGTPGDDCDAPRKGKKPPYSEYGALSARLEAALGIRAQLRDVERLCAAIDDSTTAAAPATTTANKTSRHVIIGHSFGGFLASLLAAERPDLPAALVLICPAACLVNDPKEDLFASVERGVRERLGPSGTADFLAWKSEYLDFSPALFTRSERRLAELHVRFYDFWLAAFGGEAGDPDGAMAAGTEAASAGGRLDASFCGGWCVVAQYFSMGAHRDYRAALRAVKCPVLVVHGARDVQSIAVAETYASSFGGPAEVRTIENAGHFPFDETPEELAEIVGDFLSKHGIE